MASGVLLGLGLLINAILPETPFGDALLILAMPVGAFYFAREGVTRVLRDREVGIEILMVLGAAGAAILGAYWEGATLVFLYSITQALEDHATDRTRHAIRDLMKVLPRTARLLREGREEEVPVEDLSPGNLFRVGPGEAFPTDGVVVEGRSSSVEAIVTGESTPRGKAPGDSVLAGALNVDGSLAVRTTRPFEENTISRIISMVEEAQERRGRTHHLVERFSRVYSPSVLIGVAAMLVVPPLIWGDPAFWALRAIAVLVAAAPCALAISVPVTFVAAIGRSAKEGILVKGGLYLEQLARVQTVAFDKTGTFTLGQPRVVAVRPLNEVTTAEILSLAAAVEVHSTHPIAEAVVAEARARGLEIPPAEDFKNIPGKGVEGIVDGRRVIAGSQELCAQEGVDSASMKAECDLMERKGMTSVVVAAEGEALGLIGLADTPREEARGTVSTLQRRGLEVLMLTGDNPEAAQSVAESLGIRKVHASLLPEEKVSLVEGMRRGGGKVSMVGDGVNDAPALAASDVGIAMGAAGSDVALETAHVALMSDDLTKVVRALDIAETTRSVARTNIIVSAALLAVLVPIAALGVLGIAGIVAAHEASELLIILSGLRMMRS